jgi:hypothetical protein
MLAYSFEITNLITFVCLVSDWGGYDLAEYMQRQL